MREVLQRFALAQSMAARGDEAELLWWKQLPALIEAFLAAHPQLSIHEPIFDGVSAVVFTATWQPGELGKKGVHFVGDNEPLSSPTEPHPNAVVKFARPGRRFSSATRVMALAGEQAPRLLHHDEAAGVVVMQRLGPTLDALVPDPQQQLPILAACLTRLWRPLPAGHGVQLCGPQPMPRSRATQVPHRGDDGQPA